MPAPEIIHQLVQKFDENREAYHSGKYNEARLRQEFLDKFFEALGWDVYNKAGVAPEYSDVVIEDSLEIEGAAKAPDYAFKIGRERKFYVEAKKPSVNIQYDIHPAYQLRRYAWNAHLPLSILTDFEELAVYNCKNKPDPADSAATGRDKFYKYTDYVEKWDEIAAIFSKDAVWKGSFDRFAESSKGKKGTTEVDDAFLKDIEEWRTLLARNIALRNPQVTDERQLNFAVQMTIDRIIFLRICEDKGIEPEDQLKNLAKAPAVYPQLLDLYRRADMKYNSGLFHFSKEKGNDSPADSFTLGLSIDDKVLKEIIASIYYPCPYIFKEIPVEILGQVYEQFLGKVIRLTAGHQAKVEEKPEVRKAGGVYYTPRYIVDYIVANTVGKLLEGKTPEEAAALKIVDPACGSGSFLLGAYQYLLDWHVQWYNAHDPEKWAKGKNPAIVSANGGGYRLTTTKKKEILVNNIHGVDIDAQAVEVTKLSLLLKVLEAESGQLSLGLERVLPDLGRNIQCGNSLIGPDYYANEQMTMFDDAERYRVNAFDWQAAFPAIFAKGGFDAVIGNPPYRKERDSKDLLSDLIKSVYGKKYYQGKMDFWYFFLHLAMDLAKYHGYISFITPSYWMSSTGASKLIARLKENVQFLKIIDFGKNKIFENVSGKHMVFVLITVHENCNLLLQDFLNGNLTPISIANELNMPTQISKCETLSNDSIYSNDNKINLKIGNNSSIFEKISSVCFSLEDESQLFEVSQGIVEAPDIVSKSISEKLNDYSHLGEGVFVIPKTIIDEFTVNDHERPLIKRYLRGVDVKRYYIHYSNYFVFYISNSENKHIVSKRKDYPNIVNHLDKYKKFITSSNAPFGIHRTRESRFFTSPKIIGQNMFDKPSFAYCEDEYYVNFAFNVIINHSDKYSLKYLLGILNSKFGTFWFNLHAKKRGINNDLGVGVLQTFPVRMINFSNSIEVKQHDRMVALVERILELHKRAAQTPQEQERLARDIQATDREIDTLVYQLYGLSAEEIKIVEGE